MRSGNAFTRDTMIAHSSTHIRLNISLPSALVEELRRRVPARQRARFIAETIERELRRQRWEAALTASAGAWSDEEHPELRDGEAIDRWLEDGRKAERWFSPAEP